MSTIEFFGSLNLLSKYFRLDIYNYLELLSRSIRI